MNSLQHSMNKCIPFHLNSVNLENALVLKNKNPVRSYTNSIALPTGHFIWTNIFKNLVHDCFRFQKMILVIYGLVICNCAGKACPCH